MEQEEVICISSDDENMEQSKIDNRQMSSTVHAVTKDKNDASVKVELKENNCDKINTVGQKRKASDITSDENIGSDSERFVKVILCEKLIVKSINDEKENEEENASKVVVKPQLVIKEKKTISSMEQDIFPMFISLCLQKDRSEDMKVIVNKLKRRYEQLDPTYAQSEIFIDYLNEKRQAIVDNRNMLYIHIAEVMNEMKSNRRRKSKMVNCENDSINTSKCNTESDSEVSSTNNAKSDSQTTCVSTDIKEQVKENDAQRKIKLLLKTMKKCERYIKKLEEAEVNFDDECNSNYIKLEKYKARMVDLFRKYCEYTGESVDAGRQYLRPKSFGTTGIVVVDHAITNFINAKISRRNRKKKLKVLTDALIFPDYKDILKCVAKCNDQHNLGLNTKRQHHIAKKAFTKLGEYLQRCRHNDYWDTFSLFLENREDDPAAKDPLLAEKLMQNKVEGQKKLSNVLQEYVQKQEEIKDRVSGSSEISNNEDDEEDNTENEEEDEADSDMTDIDATLVVDKDETSSGEEENSRDGDETCKSKMNANKKSSSVTETVEQDATFDLDILEVKQVSCEEENKRLQNCENNKKNDKHDENISGDEKNSISQLIKKNDKQNEDISGDEKNSTSQSIKKNDTKVLSIAKLCTDSSLNDVQTTIRSNVNIVHRREVGKPIVVKGNQEDEIPLEKEKPLLRVRSFAKPPTTWKDVQEKVGERNTNISKKMVCKEVIDLTEESSKENSTTRRGTH